MSGFRNSVFGWMSSLPELSDTFHQDHRHHEDQVIMTNANCLFLRLPDQTCSPGVLLTPFLHSHLGCYITGHPFLSPPSASKCLHGVTPQSLRDIRLRLMSMEDWMPCPGPQRTCCISSPGRIPKHNSGQRDPLPRRSYSVQGIWKPETTEIFINHRTDSLS